MPEATRALRGIAEARPKQVDITTRHVPGHCVSRRALGSRRGPACDKLAIEGKDSPYVNILVGLPEIRDDERVRKLIAALTSPPMREFIQQRYKDAAVPAF